MVIFHSLKVDFIDILKLQNNILYNANPHIKVIYCIPLKPYPPGSPKLKKPTAQFVAA